MNTDQQGKKSERSIEEQCDKARRTVDVLRERLQDPGQRKHLVLMDLFEGGASWIELSVVLRLIMAEQPLMLLERLEQVVLTGHFAFVVLATAVPRTPELQEYFDRLIERLGIDKDADLVYDEEEYIKATIDVYAIPALATTLLRSTNYLRYLPSPSYVERFFRLCVQMLQTMTLIPLHHEQPFDEATLAQCFILKGCLMSLAKLFSAHPMILQACWNSDPEREHNVHCFTRLAEMTGDLLEEIAQNIKTGIAYHPRAACWRKLAWWPSLPLLFWGQTFKHWMPT